MKKKEKKKIVEFMTYKCEKCGYESVHFKNEKKIKRCLYCGAKIQDDREMK